MLHKISSRKSVCNYTRLQPHLDVGSEEMDDASAANLRRLKLLTESFINASITADPLKTVCDALVRLRK